MILGSPPPHSLLFPIRIFPNLSRNLLTRALREEGEGEEALRPHPMRVDIADPQLRNNGFRAETRAQMVLVLPPYRNDGERGPPSSTVLDRWEEEERCLSKWELCRVAKELRKFRHFRLTLDKDPIAIDEGSKMEAKMATTRIKLVRNKREA